MALEHNGFTFYCSTPLCEAKYDSPRTNRRGAIAEARAHRWFVGRIRITAGAKRSKIRSVDRTLCPSSHLVGAP